MSTKISLTIIKILLAICFCAFGTVFFGLQNEKKIENIYDKIEDLQVYNEELNNWAVQFSANHTILSDAILGARQKNYYENDNYKLCMRLVNIGRLLQSNISYFQDWIATKITNEQSQRYRHKQKGEIIQNFTEKFQFRAEDGFCKFEKFDEERTYILNNTKIVSDFQSDYLLLVQELVSGNFSKEKEYYVQIKKISDYSSNIYLTSFFIQIVLSFMIVFLDLYTNRGIDED